MIRFEYLASGSEADTARAFILSPKKARSSLGDSSNIESRAKERELPKSVTGDVHERY